MESRSKYSIDKRTSIEIREEITKLAQSYTPEWKFNIRNPDAGSVIGMIFAGQMEDTIQRINLLPEKYRAEFVNLFGVSLKSGRPSKAIVVINAGGYAGTGVKVPRRTQLLGKSADGQEIIYETEYDICVTYSKLTYILGISGEYSKIILYQGENLKPEYPVPLFQYDGQGVEQEALLIYHSYLYDRETEEIRIRFTGNKQARELAVLFTTPELFQFSYQSASGMTDAEEVSLNGDIVILHVRQGLAPVMDRGREQYMLCLNMKRQVKEAIELSAIELLPQNSRAKVQYVSNGVTQMNLLEFCPFGELISVYNECYIGQDIAFSKQGAEITLHFDLKFLQNDLTLLTEEKKESLPIVKRKPKVFLQSVRAVCLVQEVSVEYYNGIGWKQLPCIQNVNHLFANTENRGEQTISFIAPKYWMPVPVGGYEEKCIRIMVTRADNCYIRPAVHYYPVIRNLHITYRYTDQFLQPECLKRIVGAKQTDVTKFLIEKRPFTAFSLFPYSGNYMYFGFDKKFEEGPVSLFFNMKEDRSPEGMILTYEYGSPNGFKPLQVIDHTRGLKGTGTILFKPPEDMARTTVEGLSAYWIRMVQNEGRGRRIQDCPILEQLQLNAVNVLNIEEQDTQEYVIDVIEPNMSFPLYAANILNAVVWVNEKEQLSEEQMKRMIHKMPEKVEASYNVLGEIEEFYVLWTEVENFDSSLPTDRHYLIDRLHSRILFGDGISVRIPKNIQSIAFKVCVRCCSGEAGNVGIGSIHDFRSYVSLVDSVSNPMPAYGGSRPEDMEHSLQRGSNLLSAGKRLVSEADYVREIKAFSDHIDKAACVCGQQGSDREGSGNIYIALLMKEFKQGSYSFQTVKESLEKHLMTQCEMTCIDQIVMVEPVFVYISVEVWLLVDDITETFSIQHTWQEQIEDYLEPVTHGDREGWSIGKLPTEQQIHMMLRGIEERNCVNHRPFPDFSASMERFSVRATYRDAEGTHNMTLGKIDKSPFAAACNGEHRIHTNRKQER